MKPWSFVSFPSVYRFLFLLFLHEMKIKKIDEAKELCPFSPKSAPTVFLPFHERFKIDVFFQKDH